MEADAILQIKNHGSAFPASSGEIWDIPSNPGNVPIPLRVPRDPHLPCSAPGCSGASGSPGTDTELRESGLLQEPGKEGNPLDPNFQPESIPNCEQGNRDNDPEDFGDLIQRHSKGRDPQGSLCQLESLEILEFWNGMGGNGPSIPPPSMGTSPWLLQAPSKFSMDIPGMWLSLLGHSHSQIPMESTP